MSLDAIQTRRLRGRLLELIYDRHISQQSHMDHVALYHLMLSLGFDLGENELITLLQDLQERRALSFEQNKNRLSNRTEISRIGITPRGRDLVELTVKDDGILF